MKNTYNYESTARQLNTVELTEGQLEMVNGGEAVIITSIAVSIVAGLIIGFFKVVVRERIPHDFERFYATVTSWKYRIAIDAILSRVGVAWLAAYEASPKSVQKAFWRAVHEYIMK